MPCRRRTRAASPNGRVHVVVEHRPPLGEGVQALPRHVALARRPRWPAGRPRAAARAPATPRRPARRRRPPRPRRAAGDRRPCSTAQARVVPSRATTNVVPGCADVGERRAPPGCPRPRTTAGPTGSPPNGRTARSASTSTQARAAHTGQPGQAYDGPGGESGEPVEQPLEDGQRDPGVDADHLQPRQQHQHERRTEDEAEPEAGAQPGRAAQRAGWPRRPRRAAAGPSGRARRPARRRRRPARPARCGRAASPLSS